MLLGISASAQTPANVGDVVGTYTCDLYLSLGTEITDDTEAVPNTPVTIEAGDEEGKANFAIYNLTLGDFGNLGDIVLPNIPLYTDGNGNYTFGDIDPVRLSLLGGVIKADVKINPATSSIKGKTILANVDITWVQDGGATTPIYVRVSGPKQAEPTTYVANGNFDGNWVESKPWDSVNGYFSFDTLNGNDDYWNEATYKRDQFIQPEGWTISHVIGINGAGATVVAARDAGHGTGDEGGGGVSPAVLAESNYAVKLTNTPNPFMATQIVPAYISLGTTWATAKASLTGVSDADGGVFGGVPFVSQPDALSFSYKRTHADGSDERASVIAYLWKGTYSQAEVPGNTAFGDDPTKVTMYGRDRNILGKETYTGGEVTKSDDAKLIASIEHYITGDATDWTTLEIPFDYANDAEGLTPDSLNIIFSASDYFDRSKLTNGNSLTIDDVKLVYYHELASLNYDGEEFDLRDGGMTFSTVKKTFDESKLKYTVKGRGATVTYQFDPMLMTLMIFVNAQNYSEDPLFNGSVYIVQFNDVTGIDHVTTAPAPAPDATGVYTLSGVRVADRLSNELPKGVYIVGGKKVIK